MIYIYDKSGNLLFGGNADVKLKRRVMGEETLTVTIVSATAIAYDYGAYADALGERYYLHINPKVENNGKYNSYTLVLESAKYELGFAQMQSFGRADYDLTTDLEGWVKLIVANANRVGSGWSYVINDPDDNFKTLRVDGETCLASINRIYTDFGKEFKVIGRQIVVGRVGSDLSNVLKVGRYEGLYNVTEEQSGTSSPVTRLYVYGGERNIPSNYRNPDGTTITPRLVLDAVNGGKRYLEQNVDKYGVIEDSVTFDEIYPHRTGVISSVNASDVQEFYDTSMDFDVNGQMLPGITPKVCFLTGDLAGYEFDLVSYDNTAKKFRLAVGNDGGGRELPNTSLKPKAGDKYKLVDLEMPSSYVTAGENELLAKGQETIATRSVFQSTFTATNIDPAYQQDVNFYPVPGDRIGIASNGVTKQVRIIEQTISLTSLVKIYESLAFADKVEPTALQQAANSAKATSDSIYVANKGVKDANVAAKTVTYALYDMFEIVNQGTPSAFIRAKYELHGLKDIVAFSNGEGGGAAPTIPLATYATVGVVKVDPTTMSVDANGMIAVKGDLFNLSNYYDKSASDARFAALGHVHAFSELTEKPTTLAGYGITDAMTTSQINSAIAQAKADIVNSSPAALDTLNELSAALGNDPNFATTTATALGNRLRVDVSTQWLTDTQRANGRANLGLGMLSAGDAGALRITTPTGFCDMGSQNYRYFLFQTDRETFYFDHNVHVDGEIRVYNSYTYLNASSGCIGGNTIIHAGNIGSQSVANADTVDGLHAANIVSGGGRGKSINANSGNANTSDASNASGFYFGNTVTGMPSTDWWNWITCAGNDWSGSDGYAFQLACSFWNDDFRVRRMTSGAWQNWISLIHSGNIGSQSVNYASSAGNATLWGGYDIADFTSGDFRVIGNYDNNNTWLIQKRTGRFTFANAHDWTQCFDLYISNNGTDNGSWCEFGQRNSNVVNGRYRGVRITKYQDRGVVDGDLHAGIITASGTITAAGDITAFSDIRLKDNLHKLTSVLDKLNDISAYTYTRNDLGGIRELGLIAQEVEREFPLLVKEGEDGIKSLNYMKFTAVLLAAVKELREEIKNLKR